MARRVLARRGAVVAVVSVALMVLGPCRWGRSCGADASEMELTEAQRQAAFDAVGGMGGLGPDVNNIPGFQEALRTGNFEGVNFKSVQDSMPDPTKEKKRHLAFMKPADWLAEKNIALEDVDAVLEQEGIKSMQDLAQLDDDDLKMLGIKKLADRAKFVALREELMPKKKKGSHWDTEVKLTPEQRQRQLASLARKRPSGSPGRQERGDASDGAPTPPRPSRFGTGAKKRRMEEPILSEASLVHFAGAKQAGKSWLMDLDVDPQLLGQRGIKGKKKLGEYLEAMKVLLRDTHISPEDDKELRGRLQTVLDAALTEDYHNMRTCGDKEFKENSMSYLRVMQTLQSIGIDRFYREYKKQLLLAKPRLDASMEKRGSRARDAFRQYYLQFDIDLPDALLPDFDEMDETTASASPNGVIKKRVLEMTRENAYRVTHEIFEAFDYGEKHYQDSFNEKDLIYLENILPQLAKGLAEHQDWDLVAEIISCMNYLQLQVAPEFTESVRLLLSAQNADGTWGNYEDSRGRYGDFVDHQLYLHTTMAALRALEEHFSGRFFNSY